MLHLFLKFIQFSLVVFLKFHFRLVITVSNCFGKFTVIIIGKWSLPNELSITLKSLFDCSFDDTYPKSIALSLLSLEVILVI